MNQRGQIMDGGKVMFIAILLTIVSVIGLIIRTHFGWLGVAVAGVMGGVGVAVVTIVYQERSDTWEAKDG